MKKTNTIFAILVLAVICTAFSVSGTYARYITTDSGTGTATVAKWNAVVTGWSGEKTAQTLTLNPVSNPYVATGLIAPDADAVGILTVDLSGTQVAVDLNATLGTVTVNGVSVEDATSHFTPVLKIYEGDATDEAIGKNIQGVTGGATPLATITTADQKYYIPLNGTTISKTSVKVAVGIHWKHSDTADGWNTWDTTVGEYGTKAAPTIEATINLTARQHVLADGNPVI